MGKVEEEQSLSSTEIAEISEENVVNHCQIPKFVRLKCVIVLLFGFAVLLSGIFWLPPFLRYGDKGDLDPTQAYDVVASFKLRKPVSLIQENIPELERDVLDEIGIPNSTVLVTSLKPMAGSNSTSVVFAVVPYNKHSSITSAALSLLRDSFVSLIIHQSSLHVNETLFGDPFSFEVLKFKDGITVIPQQSGFLLQKAQIYFNFTLNFSIYEIQENFIELTNQLRSELHLTSHENLYVSMMNSEGSTVAPPTTIQASVLPAVGNLPPPKSRLKQLAQTIDKGSSRNLGLNNTVFGRVKSVHLSSILEHSLNSGGSSGQSWSPSPAPLPHPHHHHHRHHHHHHHSKSPQHVDMAPAPVPHSSYPAKPPSGCRSGSMPKAQGHHPHLAPHIAPVVSPVHPHPHPHLHPSAAPNPYVDSPAPTPGLLPTFPPLPAVVFAHSQPPSMSMEDVEPPNAAPSVSPLPSSSSAGILHPFPRTLLLLLLPIIEL
ncbi:hypothetical protein NE237_008781 [Protea cynaroides]|uniref:DUF7036 domain-containing protein n=1 Tax=Protea cynaroides TaxID=273540 RepID=A0A9Q0KX57_9MAGN|nr:hypothetical protein NE237_008781 [Protea cynaroides]